MTDPLERLGLAEIVEGFGLSALPRLLTHGDPESPRLAGVLPGDGCDLERVEHAIQDLEATLNPEQCRQLSTIMTGLCAHLLDVAAPDILEVEALDRRDSEKMDGGEWKRGASPELMQRMARAFAIPRWRVTPSIRMGVMVEMVRAQLKSLELKPPGETQLRAWLKHCAPQEATRQGRRTAAEKAAEAEAIQRHLEEIAAARMLLEILAAEARAERAQYDRPTAENDKVRRRLQDEAIARTVEEGADPAAVGAKYGRTVAGVQKSIARYKRRRQVREITRLFRAGDTSPTEVAARTGADPELVIRVMSDLAAGAVTGEDAGHA